MNRRLHGERPEPGTDRTAAAGMSMVRARNLAASRANAGLSTGPKDRARQGTLARNAIRQGLCVLAEDFRPGHRGNLWDVGEASDCGVRPDPVLM